LAWLGGSDRRRTPLPRKARSPYGHNVENVPLLARLLKLIGPYLGKILRRDISLFGCPELPETSPVRAPVHS